MPTLNLMPYHQKVKDHFKQQPKTWDYFSVAKNKEEQLQQFKTDLLKNTYKFDSLTDQFIYDKVNFAKEKLELQNLPVTVYQAQYSRPAAYALKTEYANYLNLPAGKRWGAVFKKQGA
jgi:hypothetical protein